MKAITTKFIGPSNYRGSRVKATDQDGNTITLSWDHSLNSTENHDKAVKSLCVKMDWLKHDLIRGSLKNGYVYVFDNEYNRVIIKEGQ